MKHIGIDVNVNGPYLWGTNRKPIYLIQLSRSKARVFLETVKPKIKNGKDKGD